MRHSAEVICALSVTIYLARSANLPTGLYILYFTFRNFSFFIRSKAISVSTGPIFTNPTTREQEEKCREVCTNQLSLSDAATRDRETKKHSQNSSRLTRI